MTPSSSSTAATVTADLASRAKRLQSPRRPESIPRNTEGPAAAAAAVAAAGHRPSSIRPRNRRLISSLENEQELVGTTSGASTPAGGSRGVSPIPQRHPSRVRGGDGNSNGNSTRIGNGDSSSHINSRASSGSRRAGGLLAPVEVGRAVSPGRRSPVGVWDGGWMSSWSALQGLANSVLGGSEDPVGAGGDAGRKGGKKDGKHWGPELLPKKTDGGIGQGSTAERNARVRAKKMTRVLEGREEGPSTLDTNGNYKHRTSMDEQRPQSSPDNSEALVYIHPVQPQDTLAGVVLRYNCQPAVFRKANRFWPNDSIQIRKVVVLPVDACTIKGRPCDAPTVDSPAADLLAPTPAQEDPPLSNGNSWPASSIPQEPPAALQCQEESENPWSHVRWVLLDNSPNAKPVEIARMPRRTVGYFPPRRRKSQTTLSSPSTPRASSEYTRHSRPLSQSSNDFAIGGSTTSTPPRRTSNLGPRPAQTSGSYFPQPNMNLPSSTSRPRRESISEASDRLGWMRGPGGVGTLGKNVRMPGPGTDSMNSWVKKHFPGVAIDSLPSTSIHTAETAQFGFTDDLSSISERSQNPSAYNNANVAGVAGSGQGIGFENAAAAIEGWVRKLAVKGPRTPSVSGRKPDDSADLIELLDGAGSDDGRGFEVSPPRARSVTPIGMRLGREDLEGVVRGRATAGAKGGKTD